MSKPRRNKALAVLDGRLELARQEARQAHGRVEECEGKVRELEATRDQVAKAYERKPQGRTRLPSKVKASAIAGTSDERNVTGEGVINA